MVTITHISDLLRDIFWHLQKRMVLIRPFQDFWSIKAISQYWYYRLPFLEIIYQPKCDNITILKCQDNLLVIKLSYVNIRVTSHTDLYFYTLEKIKVLASALFVKAKAP